MTYRSIVILIFYIKGPHYFGFCQLIWLVCVISARWLLNTALTAGTSSAFHHRFTWGSAAIQPMFTARHVMSVLRAQRKLRELIESSSAFLHRFASAVQAYKECTTSSAWSQVGTLQSQCNHRELFELLLRLQWDQWFHAPLPLSCYCAHTTLYLDRKPVRLFCACSKQAQSMCALQSSWRCQRVPTAFIGSSRRPQCDLWAQ